MNKISKLKLFLLLSGFLIIAGCSSSKSDVTSDDPNTAFSQAKKNYDRGDYTQAIEDFSFLLIKFAGKDIIPASRFYLAQSYYKQEEYVFAEDAYRTFLNEYMTSEYAEEALYMLGMTYYKLSPKFSLDQEDTYKALQTFQSYTERFPSGKYLSQVDSKMNELKDKLAYGLYRSGILYMKMDKYRAAAVYFEQLREQFEQSEWVDDAMLAEIESYIHLGRTEEARNVIDKFYLLHYDSPLRSKVDKLKNSI